MHAMGDRLGQFFQHRPTRDFTATVDSSNTAATSATGTVTFMEGSTILGTGTIKDGVATLTVSNLAVGSHSITVVYGGDADYQTSTSSAVHVTVNPPLFLVPMPVLSSILGGFLPFTEATDQAFATWA